jgi:hypothetical protein
VPIREKRRRPTRRLGDGAIALCLLIAGMGPFVERASAVPPSIAATWSSDIFISSARLSGEINPNNLSTAYHFDYISKQNYEANLAASKDGFFGALRIPPLADLPIGSSGSPVTVMQILSSLQADTTYHYRLVAKNSNGTTVGPDRYFATFPQASLAGDTCSNASIRLEQNVKNVLVDCRAFEMVSPVDKNGGQVDPPGTLAGGGVIQAAAAGGAVTYSSAGSFAGGSQGATSASQYVSSRAGGGWPTQNITTPLFSSSYDTETGGSPYRIFSGDLARGLLLSGKHCRGDDTGCPVANPPLPGTDAPAGYQNYYLRANGGAFEALLGSADVASLTTDPADFSLSFAGASPDLAHVVLSTCSPIATGAADGCSGPSANLYKWSGGSLSLINSAPGAELAAQAGAVSTNGNRVYWKDLNGGNLYLRDGGTNKQVDAAVGGGGTFQAASADGAVAYYTATGDLWRYTAASGSSTEIAVAVDGVLGASADGSRVYFQDAGGLRLWQGSTSIVAAGPAVADAGNYPPASGAARVSADGNELLFVSSAPLVRYDGTVYDNTDLNTKAPDSQAYLYDASTAKLTCVSCNPSNSRPAGASSIPGATSNGSGPDATVAYKPRALSANGRRVFFDSADALVLTDTNGAPDAYQWEAQGEGSCTRSGGCVSLISSGRGAEGGRFVDASADGADAFFLTDESLVEADLGSGDLYDARVGGGFPVPVKPIPCAGDSCQVLPPEPVDPTLTTLLPGLGNPPVRYPRQKGCPKGKRKVKNRGRVRCVKRDGQGKKKRDAGRGNRR